MPAAQGYDQSESKSRRMMIQLGYARTTKTSQGDRERHASSRFRRRATLFEWIAEHELWGTVEN
jgi:hypothetical protein